MPLLKDKKKINNNFAPDFEAAVNRCKYDPTCKLGWQANSRASGKMTEWQIYGGISYTDDPITQMWYPSYDYFTKNGTLTGVYNYDQNAIDFGNMSPARSNPRRASQAPSSFIRSLPMSGWCRRTKRSPIAWQNIPNEGGGWANWSPDSKEDAQAYARLLAPDRRFFVTGDQVSTLPGWQEGAMMSAQHVVEQIGGRRLLDGAAHQTRTKHAATGQGRG